MSRDIQHATCILLHKGATLAPTAASSPAAYDATIVISCQVSLDCVLLGSRNDNRRDLCQGQTKCAVSNATLAKQLSRVQGAPWNAYHVDAAHTGRIGGECLPVMQAC